MGRFPWGGSLFPSWSWSRSTLWQFTPWMYMVFSHKTLLEPAQSWEDVLNSQENRKEECLDVASGHYLCMLPYLQIWFGNDIGLGLCALQCKYLAWFTQTLASNESLRTPWTSSLSSSSRYWIQGDIALKKTTQPTLNTASHYQKISWRNCERTVSGSKWILVDYVEHSEEPAHKTMNMQTSGLCHYGSLATWSNFWRCAGSRDMVQPPVFLTSALKRKLKKTCIHLATWRPVARAGILSGETQKLWFTDYTKCRSKLLIQIWILAFCLCNTHVFLLCRVERILPLILVVVRRSSLPSIARYRRPGDCMKIS